MMKKLFIYNTLTKIKEEFVPYVDEGLKDFVGIYSCGPTVYRTPHLGNLKSYIFADLLRGVIKGLLGYKVIHIVNITDVGHLTSDGDEGEDKMEKASKRDNLNVYEIAKKYESEFHISLKALNISPFDAYPKATEHIKQQIEFIKDLEKNGFTYIIDDGVYFDTSKFQDYGVLGNVGFQDLKESERIKTNQKKNQTDFALWKFSPVNEKRQMEWDSPWGVGFPGWHIECSAMSKQYLGDQFDIHTGGMDHIPVHHTNEIAQSECAYGKKPWVKYWMHQQFMNYNGERFSKSKGNIIDIEGLKKSGYSPIDFRLMVLSSHYKSFINFSYENLLSFGNARINLLKKILPIYRENENHFTEIDYSKFGNYESFENTILKTEQGISLFSQIIDYFLDDLNTPLVFSALNKAVVEFQNIDEKIDLLHIIFYLDEVIFKLDLKKELIFLANKLEIQIPQEIIKMANDRNEAKKQKKYELADKIREQINSKGYEIIDKNGFYEIKPY